MQHSLHCPPKVFLLPPGRFERIGCHSPAICFLSQHWGCIEVCGGPQGPVSSSRVPEVQRFCTKTCCAGALPHQPPWGHMEGTWHGARHWCKAARCSGGGQGSATAATAAGSTEQPQQGCHALPGPDPPTANQDPAVFNELHQIDIMVKLRYLWMGMIKWKVPLTKGNPWCRFQVWTLN